MNRARKEQPDGLPGTDGRIPARDIAALVTIRLDSHTDRNYGEFVATIQQCDEVIACYQVMGSCDFVAHVATRDVTALERFLTQKLLRLDGVARTESMVVLKVVKSLPGTPGADADPRPAEEA